MIFRLLQQPMAVLAWRQADIEAAEQLRGQSADFQVSEILADATVRAGGEWGEGVLVPDQVGLGREAFGNEFQWVWKHVGVWHGP